MQAATVKYEHPFVYSDADRLHFILKYGDIRPVYQPILSLTDGNVFGYEALSRISDESFAMNIEDLFRTADKSGKSWQLEALCRNRAMEHAAQKAAGVKLFLNINPNIIYDNNFIEGFTKERLGKYGLDVHDVIFEITERIAILDNEAFLRSINHYRNQSFGIAIDDVGAGYSGLSTIADIRPGLIKLDIHLIRDIDKDETKQLLCKAMVDFCQSAGIRSVAEGVETEAELETLIKLNVDFAQGYFLGIPQRSFAEIAPEKVELIRKYQEKRYREKMKSSVYPIIGHLSKPGHSFAPDEKAGFVYDTVRINHTITDFAVVNDDIAVGFMTRAALLETFGGRYGHSLNAKKVIGQIMRTDFLRVNFNMPVDQVSRLAMQRPFEQLYCPIVVEKQGRYFGIVTVKDLLDTCTKIEVDAAMHSNPLTGLPGNLQIEKEVLKRIFGKAPYCITYYDLDNFKAYNDAYGFQNGDLMLALTADILKSCASKNEFVGHIGGDDFIVICDYHEAEEICQAVLDEFASQVASLYRDEDLENGYIISKNRSGVTENYPIASLSIAGISNRKNEQPYQNIKDFSYDVAKLKKKCKLQEGNYFEIA
jgi:diguanylate cyclase (GGDEF)-like protein